MTIHEQIKILDNKIRSNQGQYDLDRQNAKISALSRGELDKYEYLTGEDLGYKSEVVQKAKFEYSPLYQLFNKGLDSNEKKEGLLKRLKNIEGKIDRQLNENKDSHLGIKSISYTIKEKLKEIFTIKEIFKANYYRKITIEEAEAIQKEFNGVIWALEIYGARKPKCIKKERLLINARNFYDGRKMIIDAFKDK